MAKKKATPNTTKAEADNSNSQNPFIKDPHQESGRNLMPRPKGMLIAIGGKENKGDEAEIDSNQENNKNFEQYGILRRFMDELQGKNPLIVIVPTASSEPTESANDYKKVFKHLKHSNVVVADIRNREDACKPEFLEYASKASGF